MRAFYRCFAASMIVSAGAFSIGCSGNGVKSLFEGQRIPQSQEMTWAPPLRMKIERCYWSKSAPGISENSQDEFLIVELAMTNYGNEPLAPNSAPVFELKNSAGTVYHALNNGGFTSQIQFMENLNPGRSIHGSQVYDVPKGDYYLEVEDGGPRYVGMVPLRGDLRFIWGINPTPAP
jgi:hypothetical protein